MTEQILTTHSPVQETAQDRIEKQEASEEAQSFSDLEEALSLPISPATFASHVKSTGSKGIEIKIAASGADLWRAVIIPSGGGKSTLADRFGWIDPDLCVTDTVLADDLQALRHKAVEAIGDERNRLWLAHNNLWFKATARGLDLMLNGDVRVIMFHSIGHAVSMGINVLAVCLPSETLHEELIAKRAEAAKSLARSNRSSVVWELKSYPKMRVLHYNDCGSRDEKLISFVSRAGILTPAPGYRGSKSKWNRPMAYGGVGYSANLPEWVYSGQAPPEPGATYDCVNKAIEFFGQGKVPAICADYWMCKIDHGVRTINASAQMTSNRWIEISGKMYQYADNRIPRVDIRFIDWYELSLSLAGTNELSEMVDVQYPFEAGTKALLPFRLSERMSSIALSIHKVGSIVSEKKVLITAFNQILNYHVDNGQHFVNTMLEVFVFHIGMGLGSEHLNHMMLAGMLTMPRSKMKSLLGECHNELRQTSTWFGCRVPKSTRTHLMYVNQVVGRVSGQVDAEEEIAKRLTPLEKKSWDPLLQEWTTQKYIDDSLQCIEDELSKIQIHGKSHADILSFWEERWNWAAGGSATGAPERGHIRYLYELTKHAVLGLGEKKLRLNKRGYFEIADVEDVISSMADIEVMHSGLCTKEEIGKLRALLPGNLIHYFITSYVLGYYERATGNGELMLVPSDITDLNRMFGMIESISSEGLPLMLDYADYNAQHYLGEMRAIMRCLRLQIQTQVLPHEFYAMAELAEIIVSHAAIVSGGEVHWIIRGLFTGWRSTHFINTCLNGAYKLNICKNVARRYGIADILMDYSGSGDDLFGRVKNWLHALIFVRTAEKMGFELQDVKQLLGEGEFLRRSFQGTSVTGSPLRSLTQLCSGNWLSDSVQGVEARLRELRKQIGVCERRGLRKPHCASLWLSAKKKWAKFCIGDNVWHSVSDARIHGTKASGGWAIPDCDGRVWALKNSLPHNYEILDDDIIWSKHKMTDDQISRTKADLEDMGFEVNEKRLSRLARTYSQSSFASSVSRLLGGDRNDRENLINKEYYTAEAEVIGPIVVKSSRSFINSFDMAKEFVGLVLAKREQSDNITICLGKLARTENMGLTEEEKTFLINDVAHKTSLKAEVVRAVLEKGLGSRLGSDLMFCDELLKPVCLYLVSRDFCPGTMEYEMALVDMKVGLETLFPGVNDH